MEYCGAVSMFLFLLILFDVDIKDAVILWKRTEHMFCVRVFSTHANFRHRKLVLKSERKWMKFVTILAIMEIKLKLT